MKPKVTAIIQARMSSTRLPGKVLLKVMGRSLLSYQIERLRFSKMIDKIIIATSVNREDDPIVELCQKENIIFYRGSEDDVLDRHYQSAKKHNVNDIMRLTADCPLIDPLVCDSVVEKYIFVNADYIHTGQSFCEGIGCEVFQFDLLEKMWKNASLKSEREHVTLYVRNHWNELNCITLENEIDDSKYRITVDEKRDFIVVKALLENLYSRYKKPFSIDDVKAYFKAHPKIYELNADIIRNEGLLKSLKADEYA